MLITFFFFLFLTLASGSTYCCRCLFDFARHVSSCALLIGTTAASLGSSRPLNRNRHLVHAPADWRNSSRFGVGWCGSVLEFWHLRPAGLERVSARDVAHSCCRETGGHVAMHRSPSRTSFSHPNAARVSLSLLPSPPAAIILTAPRCAARATWVFACCAWTRASCRRRLERCVKIIFGKQEEKKRK